jgi:hypothetical protein
MKKAILVLLLGVFCLSLVIGQQRVLVEREGVRTSENAKFPILDEDRSPSDYKKLGGRYTVPWAPQPQSGISKTMTYVTQYFFIYLSYFSLADASTQRQVERFQSEFYTTGEYILTIVDKDNNVVSQFSAKINILPSGMHQPVLKYIFPHPRY